MKLRNKKTGRILEAEKILFGNGRIGDALEWNTYQPAVSSLAELNKEWEDYRPAEPLIKDEKIRKAVRAWAEMNDIRFIHMCSRTRKENARIVGQNALGRTFTMEIDNEYKIRVCFKDYKECYTIAELCGEEEE
ncbi:MAG: hypothetical protein U0L19_10875 [Bacteroidales bacterium]|nr:hypothetical protein [Bacteroidales bacterium]